MQNEASELQNAEKIRAAVVKVSETERRQFAPEISKVQILNESGLLLDFPAHIMTGAAGNFSQVLADCMEPPQHFFFMSYLACLGAICANKNTLKTELRPQPRLYVVILGESADDRKSTAISKTVDFFKNTVSEFHTCFGVGSAEGLQKRFLKDSIILLVFDELKAFVGKASVDGSVLLPCVCSLFESTCYESHTKNQEIILSSAYLSILAASTSATYERCWNSAFQDIGMTNRLFIVPGAGRRQYAIPSQVPSCEWDRMKRDLGKILRSTSETPEFDFTPGARQLYESWYLSLDQSIHTKRLDTYALRFMILLVINSSKNIVDEKIAQDVIDLMNWQLQARRLFDPIDADSAIAKIEEKLRRVLATGPRSDRDLKRALHYNRVGTWVFSNAVQNLTRSGEIYFNKTAKFWGLR